MESLRRQSVGALGVLSFLIVACSDQALAPSKSTPAVPTTPTAPVAQPGPLAGWLLVSSPITLGSGTTTRSVAYVSLPSGHVNATDSVVVTNQRTGAMVRPVVIAGGFDPVAIDAAVNDSVDVAVKQNPSAYVTHTLGAVLARSPLRLVRTDPQNASTDVAVNASILAVFSEPLNPSAVSTGLRLSDNGQDIPSAISVDSSGTRVTLLPLAALASGGSYDVAVSLALAGVTGATLPVSTSVSFETVLIGDPASVSQVTGEWDATSWRFTDVNNHSIWDDPVLGWGPNAYYRLHLSVTPTDSAGPGSVVWRLKMSWQLGGADTGSADIRGTATVTTSAWFGRTTDSPWIEHCGAAGACPLNGAHDFQRSGITLTLTRRDSSLLYLDGINPAWPAREVLSLQRATP